MRILLASSELHPYSKTGGLADMVGALARSLAKAGHEITVVTPLYADIAGKFPEVKPSPLKLEIPLGNEVVNGDVWIATPAPGLTIHFVNQPGFFFRRGVYQEDGVDYPDNARRFLFLSKAVLSVARSLSESPEVVHLHDWPVAFAALMLRHERERAGWRNAPRTLLTIHNLSHQGVFPAADFGLTNLPGDLFQPYAEFYLRMNCLKAGIMSADGLTTVSPRYAREITTEEFGWGLDGCLRARGSALHGILNGVDYDEWKTTSNPHLRSEFSAGSLDGKLGAKLALLQEAGLPVDAGPPLFGTISRLAHQKGIDILLPALEEMLPAGIRFALIGSGVAKFEAACRQLAKRHPRQVSVRIGFDTGLSHRIEAACDFYLMPSLFEPCGLNQMYSLRYGTIPVVRRVGGLDDSVIDATEDAQRANGIKFDSYSGRALANAIRKALTIYASPELLTYYRRNGMAADFSWDRTCHDYVEIYRKLD